MQRFLNISAWKVRPKVSMDNTSMYLYTETMHIQGNEAPLTEQ